MEDKKITVEELKQSLSSGYDRMLQEIADAINNARNGHIIADSEEPVRDANGRFRQRAYQEALEILQKKQDFFPPQGSEK